MGTALHSQGCSKFVSVYLNFTSKAELHVCCCLECTAQSFKMLDLELDPVLSAVYDQLKTV